jgi:hypothetical protein
VYTVPFWIEATRQCGDDARDAPPLGLRRAKKV